MGGYGTYKLGAQYPDLFAKAFAIVGPSDEDILGGPTGGAISSVNHNFDIATNLRNVPLLMWNGMIDELVPVLGTLRFENRLHELGLRHELDLFPTHDHFLFSILDEWGPGRDFLGAAELDPAPSHITFRVVPGAGRAEARPRPRPRVLDLRRAGRAGRGERAGGRPFARRAARRCRPRPRSPASASTRRRTSSVALAWTQGTETARNALEVSLEGVSAVTIWSERAGIDTTKPFELSIESPAQAVVTLAGSFGARAITAPAGTTKMTVKIEPRRRFGLSAAWRRTPGAERLASGDRRPRSNRRGARASRSRGLHSARPAFEGPRLLTATLGRAARPRSRRDPASPDRRAAAARPPPRPLGRKRSAPRISAGCR